MVIHKYKSIEYKGRQQWCMVDDCRYYWCKVYDTNFSDYNDIMNIKAYYWDDERYCYVSTSYHFKPKKW